jgi:hypothetical protein
MRMAMVRAASLRGSNINIFLPSNHGSFKSVNGNNVLFPAPGGALMISVFDCDKCDFTESIISVTGRSDV